MTRRSTWSRLYATPFAGPNGSGSTLSWQAGFEAKADGCTMEECDELIAAARRSDHMFRTFENFQYHPPLVQVKELLELGAIEEPLRSV